MTEHEYKASSATVAVPEASALEAFQASLRGKLLRPGDAAYDEARTIHNGMIDRHPALIVQCAGAADVITAVNFAPRQPSAGLGARGWSQCGWLCRL